MGFKTSYKPTTLRDMLPYLRNVKQRGEETVAACPVCEAGDSNGHHLYIRESDGTLLAYCQKCNAKLPEIIKALGIKPKIIKEEMPEITEEYDHVYKNPDGTVAYWKHRVKYADGSKDFRFRYVDESGKTVFKKPASCNNLYNLDLLERADADDCLYIVEGEKCADAMVRHGLLATTGNTGAQKKVKLSKTDLHYLEKFSDIVLIPDHDGSGMHINLSARYKGEEVEPKHLVAGVLDKIRELTLFLNPCENSYERLGRDKAPAYATWSEQNRSQLIRIPAAFGEYRRAALRAPDPTANP